MTTQFIEFIQNHWMLFSAAGVVIALLIFEEMKDKITGVSKLSAQNIALLINRENALVIDLRKQQDFDNGHILNSMNIARDQFDNNTKILEPHKEQPAILIDNPNGNTATIVTKLRNIGFTKIYTLDGGINSWKTAQLPLKKD